MIKDLIFVRHLIVGVKMVNNTNFQTVKVRKEIYVQLKQLAKDTGKSMRQIVQEVVEPAIQNHIKLLHGQKRLFEK